MNFDPVGGIMKTWGWIVDHWYIFALAAAGLLVLFLLWRAYVKSQEEEPRRDAVKRARKETYRSARASGSAALDIKTLGNPNTRAVVWGDVLGVRETSHAVFVDARPSYGIFKWFQSRRFIIARHLVADTRSRTLEVKALGFTPYEEWWIPDDDFQDKDVVEEWREVLLESGADREALTSDLPSCVLAWYLRIIKAETFSRAAIRSFDDIAYNWHVSSSASLLNGARAGESPSMAADREDREKAREEEATPRG